MSRHVRPLLVAFVVALVLPGYAHAQVAPTPDQSFLTLIYLPGEALAALRIEGEARVVWQQSKLGMGVEFQGLSQEDRERIRPFAGD